MLALARGGLSADDVTAIICGPAPRVAYGVNLLDPDGTFIEPLSTSACRIDYNADATVHRSIRLTTDRLLDWPQVKVAPWQTVDGVLFDLGVFTLDTPEDVASGAYSVDGYDPLAGLTPQLTDSVTVPAGALVLDAARAAIFSRTGVQPLIDSQAEDKVTSRAMVWAATTAGPFSTLRQVNDLFAAVGYRGAWADEVGQIRSTPYVAPQVRPIEWVFDLTNAARRIVDDGRRIVQDNWSATNWFRAVRREHPTEPVDGNGRITLDESAGGDRFPAFAVFDAVDQASLQAQTDQWVAGLRQRRTTIDMTMGPAPMLGHRDIAGFKDPTVAYERTQIRTWSQDLAAGKSQVSTEVIDG